MQWYDGRVYCPSCLDCGCEYRREHGTVNHVCLGCLRTLHSTMTFTGPRLWSPEVYVHDAWVEYGIRAFELMAWVFEEEETLESVWDDAMAAAPGHEPIAAPPHHRL